MIITALEHFGIYSCSQWRVHILPAGVYGKGGAAVGGQGHILTFQGFAVFNVPLRMLFF